MTGVLDGVTVLQLPSGIAGAMAGMLLADNGADVITVEGGDSRADLVSNGLGSRQAQHRRRRRPGPALADGVDVVIESQGLDHASLAVTNPRLILCSITGYGRGNRHAGRPYIDALVAARMGMHWTAARRSSTASPCASPGCCWLTPGPSRRAPSRRVTATGRSSRRCPWNSIGACLLAVTGISAALRAREVTGRGAVGRDLAPAGRSAQRRPDVAAVPNPRQDGYRLPYFDRRCPKGFFRCADGRWLHQWAPIHHAFAQAAAAGPGAPPARPGRAPATGTPIRGTTPSSPPSSPSTPAPPPPSPSSGAAEWVHLFAAAGLPAQPVRSPEEGLLDPFSLADGCVAEVARSRRGADPPGRARLPDVAHTGPGGPTGAPPGPAHARGPGPTAGHPALPGPVGALGPRPRGHHRARPRPGHGRAVRRADPR